MAKNLPSKKENVKALLEQNKEALAEALPKHIPVTRLIRVMVTQMTLNPVLQECTQVSLISSLLESCLYGLEPDGKEAALVPFWNGKKKVREAKFITMYRGDLKIARNSGEVSLVYAECVRENDEFKMKLGLNPELEHVPSLKKPGETIGAYAVLKLKSGESNFVWMTREQIDGIKARAKAQKDGPWFTDYDEMAKKTVLKRGLKQAPRSSEVFGTDQQNADITYNALSSLPLPTLEEEAEKSIEAPKRTSATVEELHKDARPEDAVQEPAVKAKKVNKVKVNPTEVVDPKTGEVSELDHPAEHPDRAEKFDDDLPFK